MCNQTNAPVITRDQAIEILAKELAPNIVFGDASHSANMQGIVDDINAAITKDIGRKPWWVGTKTKWTVVRAVDADEAKDLGQKELQRLYPNWPCDVKIARPASEDEVALYA